MPAFYSFFKFLLYVTFLLWSCEGKVSPYIEILLLCCAVSVQAHAMKLSVHQTYKFVWLSSTNTGSLFIQRGFSLALSLTVGRGSTWGTFPLEGPLVMVERMQVILCGPLLPFGHNKRPLILFIVSFSWKFVDALWYLCSFTPGCIWHLLVVGLPWF